MRFIGVDPELFEATYHAMIIYDPLTLPPLAVSLLMMKVVPVFVMISHEEVVVVVPV